MVLLEMGEFVTVSLQLIQEKRKSFITILYFYLNYDLTPVTVYSSREELRKRCAIIVKKPPR